MTLSSTTTSVSYAGDDASTAFAFSYLFLVDADLEVILSVDATGVETVQTITTHYTLTGAGNPSGGTVTMVTPPATGETLLIQRVPARTQLLDLVENDPFPSASVEEAFDKLTMINQADDERYGRTLHVQRSDTYDGGEPHIPIKADRLSKVLGFDASGDLTVYDSNTAGVAAAAASAAAALVSETNAATSETNAATSETNAATSEANAAASETAAAASAATVPTFDTLTGNAGNYGRVKAGETDVEWRTSAETLGDISGIGAATTNTLTNKTFDANGTGNSLSNVDVADLAAGTDGELITWDATGNPATVAVGAAAQVLTSNGVGAAPTFQNVAGGSRVLLATQTASSSASLDFASDLTSTYDKYELEISNVLPATDQVEFWIRVTGDNGTTYESVGYEWSTVINNSGGSNNLYTSISDIAIQASFPSSSGGALGNASTEGCDMTIKITAPSNTSINKRISYEGTYTQTTAQISYVNGAGKFNGNTSALTGIQVLMSSGNITSGVARLYGIVNS